MSYFCSQQAEYNFRRRVEKRMAELAGGFSYDASKVDPAKGVMESIRAVPVVPTRRQTRKNKTGQPVRRRSKKMEKRTDEHVAKLLGEREVSFS